MDVITIVSGDGETSVKIIKNWQREGRPAIVIEQFDGDANALVTELPLDPAIVIELVNLFQESEHHMLRFLCEHVAKEEAKEDQRPEAPVFSILKGK